MHGKTRVLEAMSGQRVHLTAPFCASLPAMTPKFSSKLSRRFNMSVME